MMEKEIQKLRREFKEKIATVKADTVSVHEKTNEESFTLITHLHQQLNQQMMKLSEISTVDNMKEVNDLNIRLQHLEEEQLVGGANGGVEIYNENSISLGNGECFESADDQHLTTNASKQENDRLRMRNHPISYTDVCSQSGMVTTYTSKTKFLISSSVVKDHPADESTMTASEISSHRPIRHRKISPSIMNACSIYERNDSRERVLNHGPELILESVENAPVVKTYEPEKGVEWINPSVCHVCKHAAKKSITLPNCCNVEKCSSVVHSMQEDVDLDVTISTSNSADLDTMCLSDANDTKICKPFPQLVEGESDLEKSRLLYCFDSEDWSEENSCLTSEESIDTSQQLRSTEKVTTDHDEDYSDEISDQREVSVIKSKANNHKGIMSPATNRRTSSILMIMDSNSQYIEPNDLWEGEVVLKTCENFEDVSAVLHDSSLKLSNVLLSFGVKDTEQNRHKYVHRRLIAFIRFLKQRHPRVKIALSEITPRNDKYDQVVTSTNKLLRKSSKLLKNLVLIPHDNLRSSDLFSDDWHFTREGAALFALNLREGLKKFSDDEVVHQRQENGSSEELSECHDDSENEFSDEELTKIDDFTDEQYEEYSTDLNVNGLRKTNRVEAWAQSLEELLDDEIGLKCFKEFLKKEFSEENLLFWLACEKFKKIEDASEMKNMAQEISRNYLSENAIFLVNVDSIAVKKTEADLNAPHSEMFHEAQEQVFQLMKFDGYNRFLKSQLFKKCLLAEKSKLTSSFESDLDQGAKDVTDTPRTNRRFGIDQRYKSRCGIAENEKQISDSGLGRVGHQGFRASFRKFRTRSTSFVEGKTEKLDQWKGSRKKSDDDTAALMIVLQKSQNSRLDDQRGLISHELEMPDFLKVPSSTEKVLTDSTERGNSVFSRNRAESSLSDSSSMQSLKKGTCIGNQINHPLESSTLDRNCISSNNINMFVSSISKTTPLLSKSDSTLTRESLYRLSSDSIRNGKTLMTGIKSTCKDDHTNNSEMRNKISSDFNCQLDDIHSTRIAEDEVETLMQRRENELQSFGIITYDLSPKSMERHKMLSTIDDLETEDDENEEPESYVCDGQVTPENRSLKKTTFV